MGKLLIIIGLFVVICGILMIFKIPLPFGNLPGDVAIKGENYSFYFPFMTCLILSLILSLLFYLFGR